MKLINNLKIMKKEELYVAPQVEIIEVEVEKGFAASDMTVEEGQW